MTTGNQGSDDRTDERAYETLARRTREQLAEAGEATRDTLTSAIDHAKQLTVQAGEFTSEQLERVGEFLKRDLIILQSSSERGANFVQRSLSPTRIGSAFLGLASDLITSAGELLVSLGDRMEEPIMYRTGETTGPGTLTCLNCDHELHFENSGRIPPCGNCHSTEFRKSY